MTSVLAALFALALCACAILPAFLRKRALERCASPLQAIGLFPSGSYPIAGDNGQAFVRVPISIGLHITWSMVRLPAAGASLFASVFEHDFSDKPPELPADAAAASIRANGAFVPAFADIQGLRYDFSQTLTPEQAKQPLQWTHCFVYKNCLYVCPGASRWPTKYCADPFANPSPEPDSLLLLPRAQ